VTLQTELPTSAQIANDLTVALTGTVPSAQMNAMQSALNGVATAADLSSDLQGALNGFATAAQITTLQTTLDSRYGRRRVHGANNCEYHQHRFERTDHKPIER
jgi:hypothetical protein